MNISLTGIAVILLGVWLIVSSQTVVSSTLSLIWGIVVVALVVIDHRSLIVTGTTPRA